MKLESKTIKIQKKLIKKASQKEGSEASLARKLSIFPQALYRYSSGLRELPLNLYLKIKTIAGE